MLVRLIYKFNLFFLEVALILTAKLVIRVECVISVKRNKLMVLSMQGQDHQNVQNAVHFLYKL